MERTLKQLIWLYVVLLIFEGALRKWVLPSLADPLLIARDPVALGIYLLAFATGRFPLNGFVIFTIFLAGASAAWSFCCGQGNMLVTLYGIRTNYFHLPLIWVMASTLNRRDVERIGSFLLLVALPMTAIMVIQFKSPMNAPINRGVGLDETGQIFGADGRIRPPGFFSFITGPQLFFPFVAAFFFHQISAGRRLWWPVLIACGVAILIALPVSISRTVMLGTLLVGVAFVCTLPFAGAKGAAVLRVLIVGGVVAAGLSLLPVFDEGRRVFMMRWEAGAVSSNGDAWGGIFSRIIAGFTQPLYWASEAPFFGHGIGVGSNVGSRLLSGRVGFMLAEDEWGKIFLELGPVLGAGFIGFRIFIALHMLLRSLQCLVGRNDSLPILIFAADAVAIVQNQWAPPTILGFAVLGAGLLLAAANSPVEEVEEDEELEAEVVAPAKPAALTVS